MFLWKNLVLAFARKIFHLSKKLVRSLGFVELFSVLSVEICMAKQVSREGISLVLCVCVCGWGKGGGEKGFERPLQFEIVQKISQADAGTRWKFSSFFGHVD